MAHGPYLCYREILSSSSVEAAAFFECIDVAGNRSEHLLVASLNTLTIYDINDHGAADNRQNSQVLSLTCREGVYGKVGSIQVVKRSRQANSLAERKLSNDLIIISFDYAKFVTLEFNTIMKTLELSNPLNVEINGFVGSSDIASNPLQYRHKTKDYGIGSHPILTISQEENIACSLIYNQYLYFFSTTASDDSLNFTNNEHFVYDIQQSLQLYGPILDLCFISGYSKPALALLIETGSVPFGHVAKVRHTCTVAVLAVDFQHKSTALLWKRGQMPHDSFKLLPLPLFSSLNLGVFVISMNGVLKVTFSEVSSIALNSFGVATIHPSHRIQSSNLPIGYELDSSSWMLLQPNSFIGILKEGTILEIELLDGYAPSTNGIAGSHSTLKVSAIGLTVSPSVFCSSFAGDFWFVGSRKNDSALLRARKYDVLSTSNHLATKKEFMNDFTNILAGNSSGNPTPATTPAAKRQRRSLKLTPSANVKESTFQPEIIQSPISMQQMLLDIDAEETLLYGATLSKGVDLSYSSHRFEIEVVDSIPVLSSILSGSYIKTDNILDQIADIRSNRESLSSTVSYSPASYIMDSDAKDTFLVSAGVTNTAAILKISNGFRVHKISSGNYGGVTLIQTVYDSTLSYTLLALSYIDSTRVFKLSQSSSMETFSDCVLESYELSADKSAFLNTTNTIAIGLLHQRTVAQVFPAGIRLIRLAVDLAESDNEALQDMLLQENEELGGLAADSDDKIVEASVEKNYILLITQYSRFYAIEYNHKDDMLALKYSKSIAADPSVAPGGSWDIFPVSVSLFHGTFRVSADSVQIDSKSNISEHVDAVESEEIMLYGGCLSSNSDSSQSQEMEVETLSSSNAADSATIAVVVSDMALLLDSEGIVWMLSLGHDLEIICHLSSCAEKPDILSIADNNPIPDINNRLISVALVELPYVNREKPNIIMVGITSLGDLVVYQGLYNGDCIDSFRKIHHQHQLISRQAILRKKSPNALLSCHISKVVQLSEYYGVVVSGSNPAFIATRFSSGVISVFPLGFPELPYLHHGLMSVVGFRVGSSSSMEGLVTLWMEKLSSDERKLEPTFNKTQQAVVGFYGAIPSLTIPQSNSTDAVSFTKISANGHTIHRFVELARTRAEDRIEQQILERNTMIMSCSQDSYVAFRDNVLTETDVANMQADFAYYFADVTSWFQPNDSSSITAVFSTSNEVNSASNPPSSSLLNIPAPPLIDREYRVVLTQEGVIVDEYFLGETERILDIEVVYVGINHPPIVQDRRRGPAPPPQKSDKKVLILVGTSIADRHGEDGPADGRLLLFALDYTKLPNNQLQAKLKLSSIAVGPSSIIRQFSNDRILTTMGPALAIYRLDYEADANNPSAPPTNASTILLEQISFYYAKFYVTSVTIVKNFIFIADAANRIELLVWRDEDWNLTLISKDYSKATMTRAISLINDGQSLAAIVGDDEANIQVLQFDPRYDDIVCRMNVFDFHFVDVKSKVCKVQSFFVSVIFISAARFQLQ